MLVVTGILGVAAIIGVYWSARVSMGFGRDVRSGDLPQGRDVLPGRGQHVRRREPDHPQHQRRPAGPAGPAARAEPDDLGADPRRRRRDHGAPPGRAAVGRAARDHPDHDRAHRDRHVPGDPAVPGPPEEDRPDQPRDARDARRRPRHPRLRPDPPRGGPLRRGEPGPHGHRPPRQPAVRDHPPGADGDHEPVHGGGPVAGRLPRRQRRDADRQPDRVPAVHLADPVRDHDRGHHVRAGPPRPGLGRPDPGGPRDRAHDLGPAHARSPPSAAATSSSATSSSATRAPRSPCSATSRSRPTRARRRPSSAPRAAASRRSSTCCRASTTRPAGAVLVDGVDVRDMDRQDLWSPDRHRAPAGVPVRRHRSPATCATATRRRRTTTCGRRSTSPRAASSSTEMEEGLDSPIAQGGTNVSGGQRQRLAIARALAKRPEIYVFDDSFSALDFRTDARLRAALGRELGARDGDHRRPARRARSCTPTGSSSSRTAGSSASAPTTS